MLLKPVVKHLIDSHAANLHGYPFLRTQGKPVENMADSIALYRPSGNHYLQ